MATGMPPLRAGHLRSRCRRRPAGDTSNRRRPGRVSTSRSKTAGSTVIHGSAQATGLRGL